MSIYNFVLFHFVLSI
jgi:hypothetical protein